MTLYHCETHVVGFMGKTCHLGNVVFNRVNSIGSSDCGFGTDRILSYQALTGDTSLFRALF